MTKIFKNGINIKWLLLIGIIIIGTGYAVATVDPIISNFHSYFDILHVNYLYGDISNTTGLSPGNLPANVSYNNSLVGMVKAYNSTAQLNLPNGVATLINLNTERWDLNNEFTGSTFTAKETGYYQVNAAIAWYNTVADKVYIGSVYVNGAEALGIRDSDVSGTTADGTTNSISGVIHLNVGDTVALYGTSNDGAGTTDVDGSASYLTYMSIVFNRKG